MSAQNANPTSRRLLPAKVGRKVAILIVLPLALLGALAAPAGAHPWTEPAAWSGGHTIGQYSTVNQGGIVATWQSFIHDRYGGFGNGSCTGCPDRTDGIFGSRTGSYTSLWQWEHQAVVPSLVADGVVGPQTWDAARFFHLGSPAGTWGGWTHYAYSDSVAATPMGRAPAFATWGVSPCSTAYDGINHPGVPAQFFWNCI